MISKLDAAISAWPGVRRDETTQIAYSFAGRKFCWLSPRSGMVQLAPCLGPRYVTRRIEYARSETLIVRQRTGVVEARYLDPNHRLYMRWSFPGFMCSELPFDEAKSLIRQAYERVRGSWDDSARGTCR